MINFDDLLDSGGDFCLFFQRSKPGDFDLATYYVM